MTRFVSRRAHFATSTWARVALVCAPLAGLSVFVACGHSSGQGTSFDGGGAQDATGHTDGAPTGDGASGSEGGLFGDGGGGDGASPYGCSADLRSVVDGSGNVVSTCPDDQGCAAGTCIAACAAAAASHGSLGCDFWVSTPVTTDVESGQAQPCFAMFVANTWPVAAALTVAYGATQYDATKFGTIPSQTQTAAQWPALPASGVPVGDVAVLYLSGAPNVGFVEDTTDILSCPQATATGNATEPPWTNAAGGATGKYTAFHVTSTVPVTAYDVFPFGGANSHFPSAELLYPSSAWGTNYVVLGTPAGTLSPPRLKYADVVAEQDGTSVTFSPAVALPGGGSYPAVAAGTSTTFTLNAGEYAHWETDPASADLSGSVLLATKPVSVTAGNDLFRLQPFDEPGGDATHAQIAPVSALGHDYAVAPYTTRRADLQEESIAYRIVGVVDGTTLTFDPPAPGAPATTAQAQVTDFQVVGAFRVTSQDANHPFAIAQVMSTGNLNYPDGGTYRTDCATIQYLTEPKVCGDEDFVPLVPPTQFLSQYVFFTDPTYSTTTLDLVRTKASGAFQDVTVDCLGVIGGWKPVDAADTYEYARVDLLRGVVPGTQPDAGTCGNGRHVASSRGPFGLVVYGLDTYSSYGYPAGGNAAVLSGVVVQPAQ
ncbi:MAG TPA: IgGFc-binding protein [Polyangiaceae bacterium]|jgi:hypothetical protein